MARILIVEDEMITALDLEAMLDAMHHRAIGSVATGADAIAAVAEQAPDLVLMDIRLKGAMSGIEAARILLDKHRVPVIFLTSHTDEQTIAEAAATAPYGYVVKPVDEGELRSSIEVALQKHRLDRDKRAWIMATLSSIADAVVTTDGEGAVTFVNEEASALSGWSHDAAMGQSLSDVLTFGGDGHAVPQLLAQVIASGDKRSLRDATLQHRSGGQVIIDASIAPIRDAQSAIAGAVLVFRDVTDRKRTEERLWHEAVHDALTGLPNRKLLGDRLQACIERAKRKRDYLFAVAFLDLDHFKVVNDSLGHAAGDEVLVEAAARIQRALRASDTVARTGGDEFVLVLTEVSHEADVIRVVERVLSELEPPFRVAGEDAFIRASIGIALSSNGYTDWEDTLRDADTALHRAKNGGKARFEIFDPSMHAAVLRRLHLEAGLRRAVDHDELENHYQPVVTLDDNRLVGVEALVRWNSPDLGQVPPGEFIGLAEETGLIVALGEWVLRAACEQAAAWRRDAGVDLRLAVNISARQLREPRFLATLQEITSTSGFPPEALDLEITESILVGAEEHFIELLSDLKQLGLRISLDDFGTGYSSLSYLQRFPFDTVKIDRAFLRGVPDHTGNAAIVNTIIDMANHLGLDTVAEGVEDRGQLDFLQGRCAALQGYLFSRPLPADELYRLMSANHGILQPVATDSPAG